jgi:hypothetical protein
MKMLTVMCRLAIVLFASLFLSTNVALSGPVVDLPEDAENMHTILFLAQDWESRPNQVKAKKMFDQKDWCRDLRSRTHWHIWTIDQPEAKPYWKFVKTTPCLIVQDCGEHGGRILYNEPNSDLGDGPKSLLHAINVQRKKQRHGSVSPYDGPCPDGNCPIDQKKKDSAGPPPTDEIKVSPLPDAPDAVKPPEQIPVAVGVGIVATVGVCGFVLLSLAGKAKAIRRAQRGAR